MITLADVDKFNGLIATAVERGCDNKGQCFCTGKCHEIVGHIRNGRFEPNENMSNGLTQVKAKNMWGADIKDVNEFCDKITKNAGQRDI